MRRNHVHLAVQLDEFVEMAEAAYVQWRTVTERREDRFLRLPRLMDEARLDVLAHFGSPREHPAKMHSTNPLERLSAEINRRADVVGSVP